MASITIRRPGITKSRRNVPGSAPSPSSRNTFPDVVKLKRASARRLLVSILTVFWCVWIAGPHAALSVEQPGHVHHIASFNVHYIVPGESQNDWEERKHAVTRVLADMDADIIAFQEMETFDGGSFSERNLQLDWVMSSTTGYEATAVGDPRVFPHTQPILYKTDKYEAIDQGFFFFSETPDEIYSRQWDGRYPYFCSWVQFTIKNGGKDFFIFNVHNDYKSRSNRLKTSELIAARIKQIAPKNAPIVVVGDFNAPRWAKELALLGDAGLTVVNPGGSTNRLFGISFLPAIDHILVSAEFKPQSEIQVWRNSYNGIYPGDHFPISTLLKL